MHPSSASAPCGRRRNRQRFDRLQHAIRAIGDWISFYNTKRRHQALDRRMPTEAIAVAT
ncbi:MAG: integrase core domain-containing protein [Alphaproteobacteria bacterium]